MAWSAPILWRCFGGSLASVQMFVAAATAALADAGAVQIVSEVNVSWPVLIGGPEPVSFEDELLERVDEFGGGSFFRTCWRSGAAGFRASPDIACTARRLGSGDTRAGCPMSDPGARPHGLGNCGYGRSGRFAATLMGSSDAPTLESLITTP
jgi:hypothetical protein